jgi:hypothetical protein
MSGGGKGKIMSMSGIEYNTVTRMNVGQRGGQRAEVLSLAAARCLFKHRAAPYCTKQCKPYMQAQTQAMPLPQPLLQGQLQQVYGWWSMMSPLLRRCFWSAHPLLQHCKRVKVNKHIRQCKATKGKKKKDEVTPMWKC